MFKVKSMQRHLSSDIKKLTAILYLAVCGLSVAMLLLFPSTRLHNFGTHFRTPEVRRTIQSQTFLTQSDETCAHECAAESTPLPEFFTPADTIRTPLESDGREVIVELPFARLLHRMRLNRSSSGAQDPLLQA